MANSSVQFLQNEDWCRKLLGALTKPQHTHQEQPPEKVGRPCCVHSGPGGAQVQPEALHGTDWGSQSRRPWLARDGGEGGTGNGPGGQRGSWSHRAPQVFLFIYYGLILQAEPESGTVRTHLQQLLETSHQWARQREVRTLGTPRMGATALLRDPGV